MRGRGSCRLSSGYHIIPPHRLTAATAHAQSIFIHHLSYIPSRQLLSEPGQLFIFEAQLLCVGLCAANEVNMILQAMMWWLSTIGWQNNLCVFDSSWWIVSGAFGWWDNCFQSSLWSNCASSTQKPYLPLRICCPPLLKRFLGQRDRPNYSLPERETLRNSSGLGGVTDCMARTRVCLISYALYVSLSVCVCVSMHCVCPPACVYSHT